MIDCEYENHHERDHMSMLEILQAGAMERVILKSKADDEAVLHGLHGEVREKTRYAKALQKLAVGLAENESVRMIAKLRACRAWHRHYLVAEVMPVLGYNAITEPEPEQKQSGATIIEAPAEGVSISSLPLSTQTGLEEALSYVGTHPIVRTENQVWLQNTSFAEKALVRLTRMESAVDRIKRTQERLRLIESGDTYSTFTDTMVDSNAAIQYSRPPTFEEGPRKFYRPGIKSNPPRTRLATTPVLDMLFRHHHPGEW